MRTYRRADNVVCRWCFALINTYMSINKTIVKFEGSVPVSVGGYVAEAGEGGAKHVVPGLIPSLATVKQVCPLRN